MTKHRIVVEETRDEPPNYDAYRVSEKDKGKVIWTKIGIALINQDGSINVFLDALPVDGRLQITKVKT